MILDDGKDGKGLNVDIDAIELTDVTEGAVEQKLGTKYDQRDMIRMGKRQEVESTYISYRCLCCRRLHSSSLLTRHVSSETSTSSPFGATQSSSDAHGMGPCLRCLLAYERRHSRCYLDVPGCLLWYVLRHVVLRRNGQYRSNIRRPVPLGQRIQPQEIPEDIIIRYWLVRFAWMAN